MKIALSGVQCTGKTTLMNQIIGESETTFAGYELIPEVVRSIKARMGENFEFNKSSSFESQDLILTEHHRNVLQFENLVTDRCAVDAFAYATKNYTDGLFTFSQWKHFREIFLNTVGAYDVIIYLPIGMIPLEDDGVRSIDQEYQEEMDGIFQWVFKQYNVEHVILNDPLEHRFEVAKGIISIIGSQR